jgi:hypothetical protein
MEEPIYFESEKERLAYLRGKNKKVDVVPIEDKKAKIQESEKECQIKHLNYKIALR